MGRTKKNVTSKIVTPNEIISATIPTNKKETDKTPEQVAAELVNQEIKKERKPYTKKNQNSENQFTDESLKPLVTMGLMFLSERLPNKIPPTDIEIEGMNKTLVECANRYGGVISEYMPLISLFGMTAMYVLPRMQKKEIPTNENP